MRHKGNKRAYVYSIIIQEHKIFKRNLRFTWSNLAIHKFKTNKIKMFVIIMVTMILIY